MIYNPSEKLLKLRETSSGKLFFNQNSCGKWVNMQIPNQIKKCLKEGKITNAYVIGAFLWYTLYFNGKW